MKVAGSTLLYSRFPLDEACRRLSNLGFDAVDIGMQEGWAHINPSETVGEVTTVCRRIEKICETTGLDPVAINANAGDVDLDTEVRRIKAIAEIADELNINVITLPAAQKETSLISDFDRFQTLIMDNLERDVDLTVETHWGTHTEDPTIASKYTAFVPNLAYTLDPGHYFIGDHDIETPYLHLLPDVEHVHIRQAGNGWDEIQQPVEKGRIDIDAFISDLYEYNYDGVITIEYIDSINDIDPQKAESHSVSMRELILEYLCEK
jgi:sugar phosphate isomerase/epimerase